MRWRSIVGLDGNRALDRRRPVGLTRLLCTLALGHAACGGGEDPQTDGHGSTGGSGTSSDSELTGEPDTSDIGSESGDVPGTCPPPGSTSGTLVMTAHGPIEGVETEGGFAFLGIPYAEAPTGGLRFRPPEPPTCWIDARPVQSHGSVCPQLDAGGGMMGAEDCLFLNVWTPQTGAGDRPVMVFIHGGGNAIGAGSEELYDGASLAAAQDVVVVTFNYRLGALGFLTHDALAEESSENVSGNYGLLDQIAALQWVADNVAELGGDPGNVTLFGESAGAVDTCALIGSPLSAELFHRAIVQSGTCSQRALSDYREAMSDVFATNTGCTGTDDDAACLRALPVDAVLSTEPTGSPSVSGLSQGWGPHVDGFVLPTDTLSAMQAGTHNDVPLVIGANRDETAQDVPELTAQQYESLVYATFGMALGDLVLGAYPVGDYPSPREAWVALTTDAKFVCTARRSLAAAAGQRSAVYRYHFAYDGYTAFGQPPAAFHGLELVYIFGNFDAVLEGAAEYQPNADDLVIQEIMQTAWGSFAGAGVPVLDDAPWPLYDVATDPYVLLDVPSSLGEGVRTAQCDFWDSFF